MGICKTAVMCVDRRIFVFKLSHKKCNNIHGVNRQTAGSDHLFRPGA